MAVYILRQPFKRWSFPQKSTNGSIRKRVLTRFDHLGRDLHGKFSFFQRRRGVICGRDRLGVWEEVQPSRR